MAQVFIVLLIAIPIVEIAVAIWVADAIGWWNTIGLLVLLSVIGVWLVKRQGVGILATLQQSAERKEVPTRALMDRFLKLVGGGLLVAVARIGHACLQFGRVLARRDRPDPALFLGRGKVDEVGLLVEQNLADTVIFDVALSPAQQRNLERELKVTVLDRTALILEIFGQRAKSREGKLQVELAQLEHLSTRLVRGWTHLERQRGGLGKTGGPGEKQIELDRRQIAHRVKLLRERLRTLHKQRRTQRRARARREAWPGSWSRWGPRIWRFSRRFQGRGARACGRRRYRRARERSPRRQ